MLIRIKSGHPNLSLFNEQFNIPAGEYTVGVETGPDPELALNWKGQVKQGDSKRIVFVLDSVNDVFVIARAGWIRFNLGQHDHLINLGEMADVVRTIPICEQNGRDPFALQGH